MAGLYFVTLDNTKGGRTKQNGVDAVCVYAEDATDAKALAKAQQAFGASDAAWDAATATLAAAGADLEGWRLRVVITDSTPVIDEEVTGAASADVDAIAALMVTALNGNAIISGAAYSTPNLTIAAGTGVDDLGDKNVECYWYPPADDSDWPDDSVTIPSFIGTITDGGSATDDLAVALGTSSAVPNLVGRVKQS
jgi:hypothetical protein